MPIVLAAMKDNLDQDTWLTMVQGGDGAVLLRRRFEDIHNEKNTNS